MARPSREISIRQLRIVCVLGFFLIAAFVIIFSLYVRAEMNGFAAEWQSQPASLPASMQSVQAVEITRQSIDRAAWAGISIALVLAAALATAVSSMCSRLLRQMGGEPARIDGIARRIAEGDWSDDLSGSDNEPSIYESLRCLQVGLRERNERETAEKETNERLRLALDNASANVMVADLQNNIVYMNKAAEGLFMESELEIRKSMPHFRAR